MASITKSVKSTKGDMGLINSPRREKVPAPFLGSEQDQPCDVTKKAELSLRNMTKLALNITVNIISCRAMGMVGILLKVQGEKKR